MGVDLGKLLEPEEIGLESLEGKKLGIDALNTIYQFLSIIRQRDGTPLMDSDGNITSHLSGLFYRNIKLLEFGIKPAFVFDGKSPLLKEETLKKRKEIREEARKKWKEAKKKGKKKEARKYAQGASKVNEKVLSESKSLLRALGIPSVQAPSEGEAQAAYLCQQGDVYAAGSQDYDSLLFGVPKLIRNINITGKRKVPGKNYYTEIKPEYLELKKVLNQLDINREKLVEIGIFMGTDFNPGIKGIGPKRALKHVKEKGIEEWKSEYDFAIDPVKVKKVFLEPEITKEYELKWTEPDEDKLFEILHEKHEFSEKRINNALERLEKSKGKRRQKNLGEF
ncbi:MAG: flap endonuclease-1 [Candidatus Undinarchaeales archaeon]